MAYDITTRHPHYSGYTSAWALMRDAMAGEDTVKARGEIYLPMKSGIASMKDTTAQARAYDAYRLRAEFPELLAPTVRGAVGVMLDTPAKIELPTAMDGLRERATRDGLTLDALHRRIAAEVMTVGRYGLLPGISPDGAPYLSGYVAEAILNWDETDSVTDYVVLNESGWERDRTLGGWDFVEKYRECFVEDGRYAAREWDKRSGVLIPSEIVEAATRRREALRFLPFVFIDTNDLTADPDDVPLYGLAKLAVRVYRMDADYTTALHMTSEPTPVAIGFNDPVQAAKDGKAPTTLGSSRLWLLPEGGDAKYLEFSGPGLAAQETAIKAALDRAASFGAQLVGGSRAAESGEALRLRAASQTATLKTIAMTTAAGLERALRNVATWMGENPDDVIVTPNLDFFEHSLGAQDITAIVAGWQAGAYSWQTTFERMQKGGLIPEGRTAEEELALMDDIDAI
jgi:hypothetical protein